jgi:hypothetical protein
MAGDGAGREVRAGCEVSPDVVGGDLRDVEVVGEPLGERVEGVRVGLDGALRPSLAAAVAEEVVDRAVRSEHDPDDDLRLVEIHGYLIHG